jgi:hypothetical protein
MDKKRGEEEDLFLVLFFKYFIQVEGTGNITKLKEE